MTQREVDRRIKTAIKAMDDLGEIPTGRMETDLSSAVFGTFERAEKLDAICRRTGLYKKSLITKRI